MKVGILFPGYGSQFVGMGKEIYDNSRIVQEYFEEASNCANVNFVKLCFASSDSELALIQNAYLSIFLITVSVAHVLKEIGLNIDKVSGYGMGEISAICFSKGISFPDGIYLLTKITQFYSELLIGLDIKSVLINGLNLKQLKKILKDANTENSFSEIVAFNSAIEFVVTGNSKSVDEIILQAKKMRAKCINQYADIGLYSKFAEPMVSPISIYLEKIDFKDSIYPIVFNSDSKVSTKAKDIKNHVIKHVVNPILWDKVLVQFSDCDILIIPTPGKDLMQKVKEYYPDKEVVLVSNMQDIDSLRLYLENSGNK